eukprot:1919015-Amphidinium_carterae.1
MPYFEESHSKKLCPWLPATSLVLVEFGRTRVFPSPPKPAPSPLRAPHYTNATMRHVTDSRSANSYPCVRASPEPTGVWVAPEPMEAALRVPSKVLPRPQSSLLKQVVRLPRTE